MRAAAETVKPVMLELGGKNALIAYPDADPDEVAAAAIAGMNFTWCGQSCGSTSRAFLHRDIHDAVIERIKARIGHFKPGLPTDPATTMGAIVSRAQYERVMGYIEAAKAEGARLVSGGKRPGRPGAGERLLHRADGVRRRHARACASRARRFSGRCSPCSNGATRRPCSPRSTPSNMASPARSGPTTSPPRIARPWTWQAGFVWINEVGKHFLGAPFGGVKQSGIGREECIEEMLPFTPGEEHPHQAQARSGVTRHGRGNDQAFPLRRGRRLRPHPRAHRWHGRRSTASRLWS